MCCRVLTDTQFVRETKLRKIFGGNSPPTQGLALGVGWVLTYPRIKTLEVARFGKTGGMVGRMPGGFHFLPATAV